MKREHRAASLSKKGYDYYQASSVMARSKTTEAKVVLGGIKTSEESFRAVQFSGGGDDCDDEADDFPSYLTAAQCHYFAESNKVTICHRTAAVAGGIAGGAVAGREANVNPFSGEVQQQVVDLAVEGRGLDFIWARTYHSRLGRLDTAASGWTFSYDVRCFQNSLGGIDVYDGAGRKDTFKLQTNGTYTCPEFFREGTFSNNVFRLTFADTGYWEFNPFDATTPVSKLSRIVDRNGNTMSLNYDGSSRLTQVVDDLGRTNIVAYNTAGQLASVTDFSDRTVRYAYYQFGETGGSPGDLKSVTSPPVTGTPNGNDFPAGKITSYTYSAGYANARENHLLLSVIDATGQTISTHVYQHNQTDLEFLRCISVQHWTNTPAMISYLPLTPAPANQFATLRCVVNSPVGDVTEYFYDARNRCVKLQEFTGRATPGLPVTATGNRPSGKVRASDPDLYESRAEWNNDSLCRKVVMFGGQRMECVYESDLDKSTRAGKRADCRVVREIASGGVDLDGDGVADLTERVWRYEYDPRFGSDPTARPGKKLYVGNLPFSPDEAVAARGIIAGKPAAGTGRFAAGPRQTTSLDGSFSHRAINNTGTGATVRVGNTGDEPDDCDDSDGFVTSATDPRGNVTTGTYDANGNRVKVQFHWGRQSSAESDFAYNSHGQLTAITNASDANGLRRVGTFEYYSSGLQAGYLQKQISDSLGFALPENYEHDPRGNLTRCIDPRGNDTLYTYNALDQLVQASSAPLSNGGTGTFRIRTQFTYDANDNLTLVAEENLDATGTPGTNPFWRTQFIYDGGQRLSGCWRDKNGALVLRCSEIKYNAADQVVLYRSPEAVNGHDDFNTVAFAYDERGMLFREISAPGSPVQSSSQCDYDANGNLTRVSEGLEGTPSVTMMEYDGFAGFSSSREIMVKPPNHNPSANRSGGHADHPGDYIGYSDDSDQIAGGRALKLATLVVDLASSKGLKVTMYSSSSVGLRYTMFLADGKPCRATASLRPSKITDPMGNVTTFNYDANDNLKVVRHFGETN
ncbi:MAG: DUF6531 domain-containing protein, partial [Verrucomicrobiota bacterium]|nr:DUF6531 domain-containing protein [Verrucomicrobiota bacterium]